VSLIGLTAWALLLPASTARNSWIFSWDSAPYIEVATSLLSGRGLSHRVTFGLDAEIWEPLSLWPPGYSVLIAFFQLLGLSGPASCRSASFFAAASGVAVIGFICFRLFRWPLAMALLATMTTSYAFQLISTQCLSDGLFLALAASSIACLLHWTYAHNPSPAVIFGAGLLAGAAWTTRNVGIALVLATAAFLTLHVLWLSRSQVLKLGAVWLAGFVVLALPFAIRNLVTFGTLNPYEMPPSDLSLWQNTKRALSVALYDTSAAIINIETRTGIAILALAVIFALGVLVRSYFSRSSLFSLPQLKNNRFYALLAMFAITYVTLVIAARTKYKWGETIDSRYLVQIYWIVWIFAALLGLQVLRRWVASERLAQTMVAAVFGLLAATNLYGQLRFAPATADRSDALEGKLGQAACDYLKKEVPSEKIVLSQRSDLLRIHCGVNARVFTQVSRVDSYRKAVTPDGLEKATQSGILWGVAIENVEAAMNGSLGPLAKQLVSHPDKALQWQRIQIDTPALIFKYVGHSPGERG